MEEIQMGEVVEVVQKKREQEGVEVFLLEA
jgi:hypothetical protein